MGPACAIMQRIHKDKAVKVMWFCATGEIPACWGLDIYSVTSLSKQRRVKPLSNTPISAE